MDKLSTYHSAITHRFWLVIILITNQTVVTLYCVKVVVTIFGNHHIPVTAKGGRL